MRMEKAQNKGNSHKNVEISLLLSNGLNENFPSYAQVSKPLVISWWHCEWRFWNLQKYSIVDRLGRRMPH